MPQRFGKPCLVRQVPVPEIPNRPAAGLHHAAGEALACKRSQKKIMGIGKKKRAATGPPLKSILILPKGLHHAAGEALACKRSPTRIMGIGKKKGRSEDRPHKAF